MHQGDIGMVHLTALEVPVVVRVSGVGAVMLAQALQDAWERCLGRPPTAHSAPEPIRIEAFLDDNSDAVAAARDRGLISGSSLAEVMHLITPTITTQAIMRRQKTLLMLHACAVADPRSGATGVLVGRSGMGKTTAAVTLGRSFGYLTDETVALRNDNSLVAYPKPLSLCSASGGIFKEQVSPAALGLREAPRRAELAAVLMLERCAAHSGEPTVESVPTVQALAVLSPQVSFLACQPRPMHRLARMLEVPGGLRRVRYRDAEQLEPVVRDLIEAAT